jgi:hypothetical protein
MVSSSFSVVLWSMWLVLSVADGDVRAVEGFEEAAAKNGK